MHSSSSSPCTRRCASAATQHNKQQAVRVEAANTQAAAAATTTQKRGKPCDQEEYKCKSRGRRPNTHTQVRQIHVTKPRARARFSCRRDQTMPVTNQAHTAYVEPAVESVQWVEGETPGPKRARVCVCCGTHDRPCACQHTLMHACTPPRAMSQPGRRWSIHQVAWSCLQAPPATHNC